MSQRLNPPDKPIKTPPPLSPSPDQKSPEVEQAIDNYDQTREQPWKRDNVEIASDDSFPASDPPGWIYQDSDSEE